MKSLENFRDKDYIITDEGFIFCVIGSIHPSDRAISFLKYIPDAKGKWSRKNRKYKRIMDSYLVNNLKDTIDFLKDYPEYIYESSDWDTKISAVPSRRITKYFRPDEKLEMLQKAEGLDSLQRKCLEIVEFLSTNSGVQTCSFGVTGSILLDMHQSFSDIDIVIYGIEESRSIKEALIKAYRKKENFNKLEGEEVKNWCKKKSNQYPISYKDTRLFHKRRWDRGIYKDQEFSVLPVKKESEITESYGDHFYRSKGITSIKAKVSDASESIFLPSIYQLENVKIINGEKVEDIKTAVSYDWFFSDIAKKGEKIEARGKLEKVTNRKTGKESYRILIGSLDANGEDYIKPINLSAGK